MVGCTAQGVSIARSRATSYCEPCQSLTAAALSRRWRVPRGNFEGATYVVSASVITIKDGAQLFRIILRKVCIKKPAYCGLFDFSTTCKVQRLASNKHVRRAPYFSNRQNHFISRFSKVKYPIRVDAVAYTTGITITATS